MSHDMQPIADNLRAAFAGLPSGCRPDPGDSPAADHLTALEKLVHAKVVASCASAYPFDGVTLKSVECNAIDVDTIPQCHRKSVMLSLLIEVDVDGRDVEQNANDALGEVASMLARATAKA